MGNIRGASVTGLTVYAQIVNTDGQWWNGATFEDFNGANYLTYSIALTEQGSSGVYTATFPALITDAGLYDLFFYRQSGGAPAQGDTIVGTGRMSWDGTAEVENPDPPNSQPVLITATATARSIYGIIYSRAGQVFDVTAFEDFLVADYSDYCINLTENGSTGIYTGDVPAALNTAGTYEVIYYLRVGASPANGDPVVATGRVIIGATGSMTGEQFRDYLVRTFKRPDKDTEIYEAITDTVRDMRKRYPWGEMEEEASTSDTIMTLGEYQIDVESDFGLRIGNVIVQDGYTNSWELTKLSKEEYDRRYPNPTASDVYKAPPIHYCVFAGQLLIGPVPDTTRYVYHVSYSKEDLVAVTASTSSVPFAGRDRETLKYGSLSRLYSGMDEYDKAAFWGQLFESGLALNQSVEERNKGGNPVVRYSDV
jgi:hypothetical protein